MKQQILIQQLGMLAMVAFCIFVAVKIVRTRRASTNDDWTLSAKINIQIEKREKEAKLVNTTVYWYLTPAFVAVVLFSYGGYAQLNGSYIPDLGLWIYWAGCVVLYIGIYFFQQHHVKTKVQPILDQLHVMKRELES